MLSTSFVQQLLHCVRKLTVHADGRGSLAGGLVVSVVDFGPRGREFDAHSSCVAQ